MYYNSKVEVRCEAVRLAALLKDVTSKNVVALSKDIEEFILDGIELPNVYDPNSYMKDMVKMVENVGKPSIESKNSTPSVLPNC